MIGKKIKSPPFLGDLGSITLLKKINSYLNRTYVSVAMKGGAVHPLSYYYVQLGVSVQAPYKILFAIQLSNADF